MGDELQTVASGSEARNSTGLLSERRFMREPGPKRYALLLAMIVASFAIQGIATPPPESVFAGCTVRFFTMEF